MCARVYVCAHVHVCMYMYICVCMCDVCVNGYAHVHVCVHMYVHIYKISKRETDRETRERNQFSSVVVFS